MREGEEEDEGQCQREEKERVIFDWTTGRIGKAKGCGLGRRC